MNNALFERLAPFSGIVMVVLWVIAIVLTSPLEYFPTQERAFEILSENATRIQRGALIGGFYSLVFLLWFAGSVFSALRESEGSRLAAIAFGGAVVCAIGMAVGFGILWVAAARAVRPGGLNPDAAVIMYDLSTVMLASVVSIGLAVFIGATGIGSLRTGLFPAWFGWVSVVFAIGLLTPIHYIFEGLSGIWVILASLLLFFAR